MSQPSKFLINGEWLSSSETLDIINPYTQETVGSIFRPQKTHLDAAVEASVAGFAKSRILPSYERYRILLAAADEITGRLAELSRLLALEAGKPIRHARAEVKRAVNTLTISAEESKRISGETINMESPGTGQRTGLVKRFPVGPILGISPFNFPLNLVCHKVGPALASGNSILLKPSSSTPLSALILAEILMNAGLPDGILNLLPCSATQADTLIENPKFNMITFTGSAEIGWQIKQRAGYKKVCLEHGGNAAVVIEPDTNLDNVVSRCLIGAFAYAGQVCISVQRILVHKSIYHAFKAAFVEKTKELITGDPLDETVDVGPMIDTAALKKTDEIVQDAVDSGGEIQCGGTNEGQIYLPTIIINAPTNSRIWKEEAFAPLVCLVPYSNFEEAIDMVNDSAFGLQAGVFTRDTQKAFYAHNHIEAGGVIINDIPTFRVDQMPYGGVKQSGFGREGVKYTIEEMTEPRLLVLNHLKE